MKYLSIIILFLFTSSVQKEGSLFVCREVNSHLYSSAPLENIEATSLKGFSIINLDASELQFNVPVRSFQFKKSLMQEHFNENYMESDKYPNATFKGKFNEKIDPSKDGEYQVSVTGDLVVHGVKQTRTIKGTIKVEDRQISLSSKFNVLCKDHQIRIPELVFKKIAENIEITITGSFMPYSSTKT